MSRLVPIGVVALFLSAIMTTTRLALPGGTLACSCVPPQALAAYRDEPTAVIVVGTISMLGAQGIVFEVERVFKGPIPSQTLRIEGGDPAMCGVTLTGGARVFMVASLDAGVVRPSSCRPFVALPSEEGDALIKEAEATYGGVGPAPGSVTPTDIPSPGPTGTAALALPAILLALLALVAGLFGFVWLVARRGRRPA